MMPTVPGGIHWILIVSLTYSHFRMFCCMNMLMHQKVCKMHHEVWSIYYFNNARDVIP